MKVILIQGLLAPYRYPIFAQLAKTPGWDFTVWFMGKQVKNRIWDEKGLNVYRFNYRFLKGLTLNFGTKDIYPIWFNFSIFHELTQAKPDVIMMMGWDSLTSFLVHLYCLRNHIPFVLYSDSTPLELSWRRSLTKPLVSWHVRTSDALVAGGSRSKAYLEQLSAKAHKIYISYNTIDVEKYRQNTRRSRAVAQTTREQLGLGDKQIILYYGQLIWRKGIDLLIESYAQIQSKYPDLALLIIGDGPDKARLEKLAQKLMAKNVVFLPNPGDDAICRYYSIASLFVLPSREEVWGLVVNEAMAAGLPVVVSNHAGCSIDLVQPGKQGAIFRSGDVADLTAKLDQVLANPKLRQSMGRAASAKIETLNPRLTIQQFREAIRRAHPEQSRKITFHHLSQPGLVSIIIPVHHDHVSLAQTLASLEHQINPPSYEVVVEPDVHGEGSYATRNHGMARSHGRYLAFIDAGTIASPHWLRRGYEQMQRYDYVGGPVDRSATKEPSWSNLFGAHREFVVEEFFTDLHFFPTTNLFMRRSLIKQLGGFDPRLTSSGDREFGDRVWQAHRFKTNYDANLSVTHPFRSYQQLIDKQRRLARGARDLGKYYPRRFSHSPLRSLITLVLPPLWLLKKSSYRLLPLREKIPVFLVTYHLSLIHHLEVIRYALLRD